MEAITIPKGFKVTPEQFDQLVQAEQLARMELTKDGELIVGKDRGYFIKDLDIQIAVNNIIGTINWTLYDLLIVNERELKPDVLAKRISTYLLRGLVAK